MSHFIILSQTLFIYFLNIPVLSGGVVYTKRAGISGGANGERRIHRTHLPEDGLYIYIQIHFFFFFTSIQCFGITPHFEGVCFDFIPRIHPAEGGIQNRDERTE